MTAKEAREQALKVNTDLVRGQLFKINNIIKAAIDKGEYSCFVYDSIKEDVRKKLEDDGFQIGATVFDRNESCTKISW